MNRDSSPQDSLEQSGLEQVITLCDEFESSWRASRPVTIESVVARAPEAVRERLLRELIALEVELRRNSHETDAPAEFRRRFPDVADEVLRRIFATGKSSGAPAPMPQRFGRYDVIDLIGKGGMGDVYRVRDDEIERDLALKIMRLELQDDPTLRRRFIEEAQVTGQLQHPGMPPIHERGELPDGRLYYTMKLVQGRTWHDLFKERSDPNQELPRFLAIFEQVAQAVAYAHSKHVIHRDLKPANVMVGRFGEVQVMDWGATKVLAAAATKNDDPGTPPPTNFVRTQRSLDPDSNTEVGTTLGTYAYMPPEQADGLIGQVDERADVFALGSILCEILTGGPVYTGRSRDEVRRKAIRGDLGEAIRRLNESGSDLDLVTLAKECLAAERLDRPRDASALAKRMGVHLADVQERLKKAEIAQAKASARAEAERSRRKMTFALAAALLLSGVIGGGWWAAFCLDRDARLTETDRIVGDALGRAEALLAEAERAGNETPEPWNRALSAVEKAKDVLAGRPARRGLAKRTEDLHAVVHRQTIEKREQARKASAIRELVTQLDEARLQEAIGKDQGINRNAMYAAYESAFRDAGLDLYGDAAAMVSMPIAERDREGIASALDDWASDEHAVAESKRGLAAIARLIDPVRNQIRDAIRRDDRAELVALAKDAESRRYPAASVILLARTLVSRGDLTSAIELLTEAQRRFPTDFWINYEVGQLLSRSGSPRGDDGVRFLAIAATLKPNSPGTLLNLSRALDAVGKRDEALAVYRKAVHVNEILLRYNEQVRGWERLAAGDALRASDRLVNLPSSLAAFQIGSSTVSMIGNGEIKILSMQEGQPARIELKRGKLRIDGSVAKNPIIILFDTGRVRITIPVSVIAGLDQSTNGHVNAIPLWPLVYEFHRLKVA
jgi:eukaryotic-like serine/threonine-protein kinase